jgi:hypothetical protein
MEYCRYPPLCHQTVSLVPRLTVQEVQLLDELVHLIAVASLGGLRIDASLIVVKPS